MADWNAELYSRFERERTLPSYDLVRAVEGEPKTVLDIGCGIGNSTQVVAEHFPHARVVGADNSPDMLRYSREKHPELEFITLDAAHDLHKNQHRQRQHAEDQVALLAAPAFFLAAGTPVGGHGIRQGRVDRQMADDIQNTNNKQYPEQRAQFIIFHHRFLL